ncbi:hypothetical protein FOS14_19625 [Skermania sp. ID1734]|uniref:hypothetical protein n=1 Tax=Skermania sp. ID1734 TaxID=2597516 RepID=UPI00117D3FDC|nr:hypothetical protein [Skermania sp. ID1734]TSD94853.1 hypothetical protein FOS14_19625 [Skermania sp. ID1734]
MSERVSDTNRCQEWVTASAERYSRRAVPVGYVGIMVAGLPARDKPSGPTRTRGWSRLARKQRTRASADTPSKWARSDAASAGVAQGLAATCIDVIDDIARSSAWKAAELDLQRVRVDLARERFHILSSCADLHQLQVMLGGDVDHRDRSGATDLLVSAANDRRASYNQAAQAIAERIATLRAYYLALVQIKAVLANRDLALTLTGSAPAALDLRDRIVAGAQADHDALPAPTIELDEIEANLSGQLEYLAELISSPGLPLHTPPHDRFIDLRPEK